MPRKETRLTNQSTGDKTLIKVLSGVIGPLSVCTKVGREYSLNSFPSVVRIRSLKNSIISSSPAGAT